MLTEEQKIRAIELYFKYGKKLAPVVREPGYSSKRNQQSPNRSWEQMVALAIAIVTFYLHRNYLGIIRNYS